MLSCRQLTELVTDHLEGKLSLGDRLRFQMHLGMCKHCRAYLRQMKLTIATLGQLPADSIPDDVRTELLQRFKTWKR
jgi:predicted anti-sigma-YlaC factor YlaD